MTFEQFKQELTHAGFEPCGDDSETMFEHRLANLCVEITNEGGKVYRFATTSNERSILDRVDIDYNFEKTLLGTFTFESEG